MRKITFADNASTYQLRLYSGVFSGCPIDTVYLGRNIDYSGSTAMFPSVKHLTVGGSVATIDSYMFYGCSSLKSITFMDGAGELTIVGSSSAYAFYNCAPDTLYLGRNLPARATPPFGTSIKQLTIGSSVTTINSSAFVGCSDLKKLTIADGAGTLTLSGTGTSYAFYNCAPDILYLGRNISHSLGSTTPFGTSVKQLTVGGGATSIGSSAFRYSRGLSSVTIGSSVTTIGSSAFYECSGLKKLILMDGASTLTVNGTGISDYAFYYGYPDTLYLGRNISSSGGFGTRIKQLTISNSVTAIGNGAFSGCSGLSEVSIPGSVTTIGSNAFRGCGLSEVSIGSGVTSIGEGALSNCIGLTAINVVAGNANYLSENGVLFNKNKTTLIQYPAGKQGAYAIPNSVITISGSAFYGCIGLTEVSIPNSVSSIGSSAFQSCSGLTEVSIPDSVTAIGDGAFRECLGLSSVTIGSGVKTIGGSAFYGCSGLLEVSIPDSVTAIGGATFQGCLGLSSVTIGNSVKTIGDYAFYNCSGLTKISIPDSVTAIGSNAFYSCSGLRSVTIGNGVKTIGNYAFSYCSELTSVTIGSGVTLIGYYAFERCTGLKKLTLMDGTGTLSLSGTTTNSNYAFQYGNYLDTLYLGRNISHALGSNAPFGTSLKLLTIGDSVTTIGSSAFRSCSGLTSVTIPSSVTTIGSSAFSGCGGLKKLILADGTGTLTLSGASTSYAFNGCTPDTLHLGRNISHSLGNVVAFGTSLKLLTIGDSVTTIGNAAFYGCFNLTSVAIPNSVTTIGSSAFSGCNRITTATIPNSVTSIGERAFSNCSGLTAINVAAGNANYSSENGVLFSKNKATLIQYPAGKQGAYAISNSVTTIGNYAFSNCNGLTEITIPNSVTSIGDYAFSNCSGLTAVTSLNPAPPTALANTFQYVNSACCLHVPTVAAVAAYRAATGWSSLTCTQAFDDSYLASLSVSSGTLSPAFYAYTTSYSVTVPYNISTLTITAVPANSNATVAGTGAKSLNMGSNTFDIIVTAQDSVTTTTYTLTVTRVTAYTVTFDSQSGSSVASQTIVAGGKVSQPSAPTRAGYAFGGWYKESACINAWNFATDIVTSNITLYAKWTSNTPTAVAKEEQVPQLKAWASNSTLHVSGLATGKAWAVYSIAGSSVYQGVAIGEQASVTLNTPAGVYVVVQGKHSVKVAVK